MIPHIDRFVAVLLVTAAGCAGGVHQHASGDYQSSYIVDHRFVSRKPFVPNQTLAIAEVGEAQPSESVQWESHFLKEFREKPIFISGGPRSAPPRWEPPATRFSSAADYHNWSDARERRLSEIESEQLHAAVDQAIAFARQAGAKYLLLTHVNTQARPLRSYGNVIELFLIFPMWVVPTEDSTTSGDITLALLSTDDDSVVFLKSIHDEQETLVPVMVGFIGAQDRFERTLTRRAFDALRNHLERRSQ